MPQVEALAAPAADIAAFFSAPPADPAGLLAARARFYRDPAAASKFEDAVREARAAGQQPAAGLGSWVAGEYAQAIALTPGSDERARFVRGTALLETGSAALAAAELHGACRGHDAAMAAAELHALAALQRFGEIQKLIATAPLSEADKHYFQGRLLESNRQHAEAVAS